MWYIKLVLFLISLPGFFATNKTELPVMMIERIEIVKLVETFMSFNASTRKINRRDFSISFYATVRKYVPHKTSTVLQLYAMFSNEYRRTPIFIEKSVCDFYDFEYKWIKESIKDVGNIPDKCDFPLGFYYLKDYIVDGSKFPEVPWKKIMLEVFIKFEGEVNFAVRLYVINNQKEYKLLAKLRNK